MYFYLSHQIAMVTQDRILTIQNGKIKNMECFSFLLDLHNSSSSFYFFIFHDEFYKQQILIGLICKLIQN